MDYRPVVRERIDGLARAARTLAAAVAVIACVAGAPAHAADKAAPAGDATVTTTAVPPSVTVDSAPKASSGDSADTSPNRDGKRRRSRSDLQFDGDPDFDSLFTKTVNTAPWIVGLVFLVVGSIFLTPLILLVGIIWYKLRKTRLQNEALLKLAEKGVMPPAQAVDAVVSGMPARDAAAAQGIDVTGAAVEAPRPIGGIVAAARKRAAWSDLRKGVLMATFGLAFVFYSMIDSGSANWLGLALLFVGTGYVALWWLEDKQIERPRTDGDVGSRPN